jgi:hypothetical protein
MDTATPTFATRMKLTEPPTFSGKSHEVDNWFYTLERYFHFHKQKFMEEDGE